MPEDRPVLLVTGEYPPAIGGVGDYSARLTAVLRQQGARVQIASGPAAGSEAAWRVPRWTLAPLTELLRAAPDRAIVHVQYEPAAFELRAAICLTPWLARRLRPDLRVVTTFHDARVPYLFRGARFLRPLAPRVLARGSHAAVAADPGDLRVLGVSAGRGFQIPIGSNVPSAQHDPARRAGRRRQLGFQESALVVAYFGFLNASKGVDTAAAAVARLAADGHDARLLLVGARVGASDRTDQDTARGAEERLGSLGSRLVRTGTLRADEVSDWLSAADVALLPYADGASPRRGSLLACAASGLPIVTTRGPGLAVRLAPDAPPLADLVLSAEPGDARSLAGLATRAARDPEERARLQRASERIAAETSWDRIARDHLSVYAAIS